MKGDLLARSKGTRVRKQGTRDGIWRWRWENYIANMSEDVRMKALTLFSEGMMAKT